MFLVAIILLLILIPAAYAGILAAPFVPTWGSDVQRVLKLIPKRRKLKFCELGFGSGRVLEVVGRIPGVKASGYEIQPLLFLIVWLRFKVKGLRFIDLRFGDFFKQDLTDQDIIYIYWTEKTVHKAKNLKLKKGAVVISYAFPIPSWKPIEISEVKGKLPIYVFRFDFV